MTIATVTSHCVNCDGSCDHERPPKLGFDYAPWVTLADGSKVIKYCSVGCWRHYERAQKKLLESKCDPPCRRDLV